MWRLVAVACLGLLLGGCATRGPLKVSCPGFRALVEKLPPSPLVEDIQSDVGAVRVGATDVPAPSRLQAAMSRAAAARQSAAAGIGRSGGDVLLLSGGGQWGAFGAGFLEALHRTRPDALPRPALITGVSTGALQALFLGRPDEGKYRVLLDQYQPSREGEIVDRGPLWAAAITGSVAGLKPLKRRIEAALCTDGDPARGCPMIEALAEEGGPDVLIGFVEASTGDFLYADVRRLARLIREGSPGAARHAQQCLAGAALASSAIPVFLQQVRVDGHTYYDGGVRLSLFEAEIAREAEAAGRAVAAERLRGVTAPGERAAAGARMAAEATPTIFAIKNGNTTVSRKEAADRSASPLTAALRAQTIINDQVQLNSISELRLAHPTGPIRLITADGWNRIGGCVSSGDVMFSPEFMRCLARFGQMRAAEPEPWRTLRELPAVLPPP